MLRMSRIWSNSLFASGWRSIPPAKQHLRRQINSLSKSLYGLVCVKVTNQIILSETVGSLSIWLTKVCLIGIAGLPRRIGDCPLKDLMSRVTITDQFYLFSSGFCSDQERR